MSGQLVRALPRDGTSVRFTIDGDAAEAFAGESLLVAILTLRPALRRLEFGGETRAGFCLMGACQDCWVWVDDTRKRACTTEVRDGMRVALEAPSWT
jgi:predicted molibdopterin-dependent oxidoreductase YjgC